MTAVDFGPAGAADVTADMMEAADCGPIVHEDATPDTGHPLLRVKLPTIDLQADLAQKASRTDTTMCFESQSKD